MTVLAPYFRRTRVQVRQHLHVVHGVASLDLGGPQRFVVDLVRAGLALNQRVSVICIERFGTLASQVESLGAEVFCLDKPAGRRADTVARAVDVLHALQPDVVHTHQIGALWQLGQAARQIGHAAVLHTEYGDPARDTNGWLEKLRMRLRWRQAAPLARRFCCVSEDIARSVRRWGTVPRTKVDVVPSGIDVDLHGTATSTASIRDSLHIPRGALVIGTVGRLVEAKRQDLLIRAFAALREQQKLASLRLLILGDGDQRQRLENLARSLGVGEQTIFAGYQPHPEYFLQAMDLFVLTSRHAGLPLALLEAWAAGLCVVSSAVGAIPRTVIDGVNGVLFPSGDRRALTAALATLLDSPETISQLGRAGRVRAEHRYSLDHVVNEYERRYLNLIAHSAAGETSGATS